MQRWIASLLFLASVAAVGQSPTTGRVVFYRPKLAAVDKSSFLGGGPVWIDGQKFAQLDGDHFIAADLAAGHHVFRASDKKIPIAIDVEAGKTYYLRQEMRYGPAFPKTIFTLIDGSSGAEQLKLMKPESAR